MELAPYWEVAQVMIDFKFYIYSSNGQLAVNSISGEVIVDESRYSTSVGEEGDLRPIRQFDLVEWREHYPGEYLTGGSYDILDFGYWYLTESGTLSYEIPAILWREEYRSRIKEQL
jgi:hypothetical protein